MAIRGRFMALKRKDDSRYALLGNATLPLANNHLNAIYTYVLKTTIIMLSLMFLCIGCSSCFAETGVSSYFTRNSCLREGSSTIMSNGEELNDDSYIMASWNYPLGTPVLVSCPDTGKVLRLIVSTRGPAKRLVKQGRIADLSKRAFYELSNGHLEKGLIKVNIERTK